MQLVVGEDSKSLEEGQILEKLGPGISCCIDFLCFPGLAIIQRSRTDATVTHQFSITEPSIMNISTQPHYRGFSSVAADC